MSGYAVFTLMYVYVCPVSLFISNIFQKMKKHDNIAVALSVAAMLCVSCSDSHKDHVDEAGKHTHADEIVFTRKQAMEAGLKLETVTPGDFTDVIKVAGQIVSPLGDEQTVAATASGIVTFTNGTITDGSAVRTGQSIVKISAKQLQDGAPGLKAKAEYEVAEREYRRAESLVADKIISVKDFEQIKLRYETAKAAYIGLAERMTDGVVNVVSPINGFVKNRFVKQGDYVNVGDPIVSVTQNRRLQLVADVPERYAKYVKHIGSANFKPAYDKNVYRLSDLNGKLLSYAKTVNQGTSFLPVTFEFDNIGEFVAGSFADVYLLSHPKRDAVSVPVSALTEEQGVYYVYLQAKDNKEVFMKREVSLGMDNGDRVEIVQGLSAGDIVVTKGTYQVKLAASATVIPEGHTH